MITEFKLPQLVENIESCDVVAILVSVGDAIEMDQPILEIETDKAAVEVPSSVSGVVTQIHVKEGDTASVGQPLLAVDTSAESEAASPHTPEASRETPSPEAPPEIRQPPKIPAVQTQPTTPLSPPTQPVQQRVEPPSPEIPHHVAPAAPSVRHFSREIGIDIDQVPGTGPGGRISLEDVKNYARQTTETRHAHPSTPAEQMTESPLPDFSQWGEIEREPMSNVRRATATHLSLAWSTIPHVTHYDKADITELEKLRKQFIPRAEAAGGKLTITAIVLKVVSAALKQFPKFNASVDMASEEVIYKKYHHIGVAVDTAQGLLVPVIRDVDRKNIIELSVELTQIAEQARNRKLSLDGMKGGTFTITNLGGIGGTHFSPIINAPEVAILGIARSRIEPVFIDDQFQPRLMLPLALSYDHRLIDGADAARFLRWLVEILEQPFVIALEG
ncbi:MAG: 2-oxo acid dehydrogenase subunit E2 [Candidatus Poribacteria bacterium]|nr:2-oxo acid dehydrogenase subunit E2 [Candidatus Poribacteria bacterium]